MNSFPRSTLATLIAALLLAAPAAAQAAELHVAPSGNDANPGTRSAPLRTVQRAADLAQAGDVVTVHEGVYRERISPPRGGESDSKRIVYQAAAGEKVEIKGSEIVKNWVKVQENVWKAVLPNSFFGAFNPYSDLLHGDWFGANGRQHHTGAVYLNGEWLIEARKLDEVLAPAGTAPAWLAPAGQECLLNVAWLRPDHGANRAPRTAATRFTAHHGTRNAACSEGGECVGWIVHGDWLRYERIDFGARTEQMEIRAASATEGGTIEVRLDGPDGELLGSCRVPNTGDWQSWSSFKAKIKPLGGVKTVCLVFKGLNDSASDAGLWYAEVDKRNTTLWAQFKNIDPNAERVEINVRRTVFYPQKTGINYITVRGFSLRDAATPWAPPTAEQIGLIGTHWSKGWIIENNVISHSVCSGIALGKYGDEWDNRAESAEGYVGTIQRALKNGWNKETVGQHVVRNNDISHCEQTGVVGSMGAAFSTVTGNTIHDIHVRRLFSGAEMAGIKFHGAIDVVISHNHIHHTTLGVWLDWMAQGARLTGNLMHDNRQFDLFFEVDHGPFLVDNNILLSPTSLLTVSQGGAFVHNLMAGGIMVHRFDGRMTPLHKAHSTELAGLHNNPCGDDRYFNNLFVERGNLSAYDTAQLPVRMEGNVFLKGAKPCKHEKGPLLAADFNPAFKLVQKADGYYLAGRWDTAWTAARPRKLVTTALLGKASIPNLPYEQPDGAPLRLETDYFGKGRNESNPTPGPFENPGQGEFQFKVYAP